MTLVKAKRKGKLPYFLWESPAVPLQHPVVTSTPRGKTYDGSSGLVSNTVGSCSNCFATILWSSDGKIVIGFDGAGTADIVEDG